MLRCCGSKCFCHFFTGFCKTLFSAARASRAPVWTSSWAKFGLQNCKASFTFKFFNASAILINKTHQKHSSNICNLYLVYIYTYCSIFTCWTFILSHPNQKQTLKWIKPTHKPPTPKRKKKQVRNVHFIQPKKKPSGGIHMSPRCLSLSQQCLESSPRCWTLRVRQGTQVEKLVQVKGVVPGKDPSPTGGWMSSRELSRV